MHCGVISSRGGTWRQTGSLDDEGSSEARTYLFDTSPQQVGQIAGDLLSNRYRRAWTAIGMGQAYSSWTGRWMAQFPGATPTVCSRQQSILAGGLMRLLRLNRRCGEAHIRSARLFFFVSKANSTRCVLPKGLKLGRTLPARRI